MRLYARQKVFSFRTVFSITDERGNDRYRVRGELLTLGKRLHVYDNNGREVAMIRQRLLNLLPTYDIYIGGRHAARIVKKITLLRPSYVIRGCNWKVQGNFLQHDYRIYRGMSAIAGIRKRWLSFGDCFELDVPERENELLSVCMMLVIDCVMDAEEAARSSGVPLNTTLPFGEPSKETWESAAPRDNVDSRR